MRIVHYLFCWLAISLVETTTAIPDPLRFTTIFSSASKQLQSISLGNCSLTGISPPLNDTKKSLPTPSPGLDLKFIALGRGTQNYSCTPSPSSQDATKDEKPVAVGAVATLFDASCIAATSLSLLHELPSIMGRAPLGPLALITELLGDMTNSSSLILGEHYFNAAGEPTFNLTMSGSDAWAISKKDASVPAPRRVKVKNACPEKGQDVAWLKLDRKQGNLIKEVYRVVTFQGSPPPRALDRMRQFW